MRSIKVYMTRLKANVVVVVVALLIVAFQSVTVQAVDWHDHSGLYFHYSFLLSLPLLFFSLSQPFNIEGVLGSKNLFCKT